MANTDDSGNAEQPLSTPSDGTEGIELAIEMPDAPGTVTFRPGWQIFMPTLVIAISYGLCLLYLYGTGRAESALFRLIAIITALGVPLLAAHAFLRFETVRVRLIDQQVLYHPGWPAPQARGIPIDLIASLKIKRGIFGRVFGGGTLILHTTTGAQFAIADLRHPMAARLAIEAKKVIV